MDLVINENDNVYKIKVHAEVYKVEYPSWEQANTINEEIKNLQGEDEEEKNSKVSEYIKNKLIELGLDEKFFSLKQVKSHHVLKVWSEINSIKK